MSGELLLGKPHPALRGAVIRYEGFAERAHGPVLTREPAASYVPIIIDLDAGWTVVDGRQPGVAVHLGSFVAGLTDGPVLVEHPGTALCSGRSFPARSAANTRSSLE